MSGLGLYGQILRPFKLQNPLQIQLVHFPFLDLGHPGRASGLPASIAAYAGSDGGLIWSAVLAMLDSIWWYAVP